MRSRVLSIVAALFMLPRAFADAQPSGQGSTTTLRIGIARVEGGYTTRTMPLEEYVAGVLTGEALPAKRPSGPRSAGHHDPDLRARESFAPRRRRIRPVRSDTLPGLAPTDAGRRSERQPPRPAECCCSTVSPHRSSTAHRAAGIPNGHPRCGPVGPIPPTFHPEGTMRVKVGPGGRRISGATDLLKSFRAGGFKGDSLRNLVVAGRNASGRVTKLRVEGLVPAEVSGQDLRTDRRPHSRLAAHQEHGVRAPAKRVGISLLGSRLWTWRWPVRDRVRGPCEARCVGRAHPRAIFSGVEGVRRRGCRAAGARGTGGRGHGARGRRWGA